MRICPFCHFQPSNSVGRPLPLPCDVNATHTRCKACASVADIDAKIEKARQDLMDMQAERLRLLSEVNHAHDQLSERFPVEILSSIFQHCLPDWETLSKSTDGRLASVPLRLSQVSRRWRTISHSISQLWAILPLYVMESQEPSLPAILDVVQAWLGRPGEFNPLSIILDIDGNVDFRAKHFPSIFTALKNYAGRVHHFQIKATPTILRHLCYLSGEFTTLRISCVKEQWHQHEHRYHPHRDCGKIEPEHLYVEGISCDNFHISLNRLTHLDVQRIPFSDVAIILRDAPHLVFCHFSHPKDRDEPEFPADPLVRPALKHLYLYDTAYFDVPIFVLEVFTFPSLRSLALEGGLSVPLTDLIDHLLRSGSQVQLEELSLRGVSSDDLRRSLLLPQIIGPITGRSLRHLEVTVGPMKDCLQLASILKAASCHLLNLRTLRLNSSAKGWVYILQKMLSAISAIASVSMQPLSLYLWFDDLLPPINEKTRDFELDINYGQRPLAARELRDMMSTMKNHPYISVTMAYHPWPLYYSDDDERVRNITEEVLVTLARLLHHSRMKEQN